MSRKKIPYEENHRKIDGFLEKKCSEHQNFFPDEDSWLPCTIDYFYINNKNKSDGLYPYCKRCASEKSSLWFLNNRERHYQQFKKFMQTSSYKEYTVRNGKKMKLKRSEWRRNHKDKVKEYNQKWNSAKGHEITKEELDELYNFCNYSCMYCGITETEAKEKYGKGLFKDHFVNDGSNTIDNCVLCCNGCSSSKWNKDFNDWYTPNNTIYSQERFAKIKEWINRFLS